jgi:tripartite-type tricarboxylate transporter receptor subunit TctC
VTVIVPSTPAGTTDILGRLSARTLEQRLGKPFVIENRRGSVTLLPGAAGCWPVISTIRHAATSAPL